MADLTQNACGLHRVRIVFKEIDALHDITCHDDPREAHTYPLNWCLLSNFGPMERKTYSTARPEPASPDAPPGIFFQKWSYPRPNEPRFAGYKSPATPYAFDVEGQEVKFAELRSLRCTIGRQKFHPNYISRTFVRKQAKPLCDRWLYVFKAQDIRGKREPELIDELYFSEPNMFYRVSRKERDRSAQEWEKSRTQVPRPDEAPRSLDVPPSSEFGLFVQEVMNDRHTEVHYFFFLAHWQLPWDGIERIRTSLEARAVRFRDCFYTDIFDQSEPAKPEPLLPDPKQPAPLAKRAASLLSDGKLGFVLYLPNSFEEARRRANVYAQALRSVEWA